VCWYVIILDGEIAHLGIEAHATKALAESSAAQALAQQQADGRGFPHALLEVPEPLAVTPDARWYVLEIVERVAVVSPGPFEDEADARKTAVRLHARWAVLRVCGLLAVLPPRPRPRRRSTGSRTRAQRPRTKPARGAREHEEHRLQGD
jgi:hypothetical protein